MSHASSGHRAPAGRQNHLMRSTGRRPSRTAGLRPPVPADPTTDAEDSVPEYAAPRSRRSIVRSRPTCPVDHPAESTDHQAPASNGTDVAPLLYTADQAAAFLQVRPSWLRRKATARAVPCRFIGKHLRFSRTDIEAIANNSASSHPQP